MVALVQPAFALVVYLRFDVGTASRTSDEVRSDAGPASSLDLA